jgi:polysaccharide export outer membrane protein
VATTSGFSRVAPGTLSATVAVALLLLLLVGAVQAKDKLMGVMLPGESQKQSAVRAALSGIDPPLDAPATDLSLPIEEVVTEATAGEEEQSEIEKKVAESLESISLEERIRSQVLQAELEQFGYEIFSRTPTTFAPVEGIPVPPDYIIGPGDTFVIQIYGSTDVEYRLVVTREGKLLIPEVGDIQLAGLSFDEAKMTLKEQIGRLRIGVKSVVTLADLHTIQVMVVGDVARPGAYTVSGLSSLLNTLITTGGIRRTGTLRDVQVRRNRSIVARMDLYQVLLKGVDESNIYLRQGDTIFVPPIGRTIGIAGEVHRPAIYELKDEQQVDEVIALSGGLLPTAARSQSHIERITSEGMRTLIDLDLEHGGGQTGVSSGDLIRIFPVQSQMERVVLLSGHLLIPGGYQWRSGLHLSSLIDSPALLRQNSDHQVAMIVREQPVSRRLHVDYFRPAQLFADPGGSGDPLLEPRDEVIFFDNHSPRAAAVSGVVRRLRQQATARDAASIAELKGYIRHPGEYPLGQGQRLLDLVDVAGGVQSGSDLNYALLVRQQPISGDIEFIHLSLAQAFAQPEGDHNPLLKPLDRIYLFDDTIDRSGLIAPDLERLRRQASYSQPAAIVEIAGLVRQTGEFPLTPGMRVADLITAAGGMDEEAFGLTASLSRRHTAQGDGVVLEPVTIRLDRDAAEPFDLDLVLEPYDRLALRRKPGARDGGIVTIEGEVRFPGEYRINRRETLCQLVDRAGGLTADAYPFGAYFTRDSVRKREQAALDRLFDELDDQLVAVHLSPGFQKDEKLPINSGADELYRVIRQLKKQSASGRLVIDLARISKECDEEANFPLEAGDKLRIPSLPGEVTVVGEVYHPTSHLYQRERGVLDYIDLSGGVRELANRNHAFVIQANGAVETIRPRGPGSSWFGEPANLAVTPGSTIVVPLSVDRINERELSQSWVDLLFKLSVTLSSVDYLFEP